VGAKLTEFEAPDVPDTPEGVEAPAAEPDAADADQDEVPTRRSSPS
jgi:hypothetical protein